MKFKDIETAKILITQDGKILIEQYSIANDEPVQIFLTIDQLKNIESWVFRNKDEIELLWNNGMQDE